MLTRNLVLDRGAELAKKIKPKSSERFDGFISSLADHALSFSVSFTLASLARKRGIAESSIVRELDKAIGHLNSLGDFFDSYSWDLRELRSQAYGALEEREIVFFSELSGYGEYNENVRAYISQERMVLESVRYSVARNGWKPKETRREMIQQTFDVVASLMLEHLGEPPTSTYHPDQEIYGEFSVIMLWLAELDGKWQPQNLENMLKSSVRRIRGAA